MHQAVPSPQAPERRSAHLLCGTGEFRQGLDRDAITGADIVQKEIAEGTKHLVAESSGNDKRAAVNHRPRGRCCDGAYMAGAAPDLVETLFTIAHIDSDRAPRWS